MGKQYLFLIWILEILNSKSGRAFHAYWCATKAFLLLCNIRLLARCQTNHSIKFNESNYSRNSAPTTPVVYHTQELLGTGGKWCTKQKTCTYKRPAGKCNFEYHACKVFSPICHLHKHSVVSCVIFNVSELLMDDTEEHGEPPLWFIYLGLY